MTTSAEQRSRIVRIRATQQRIAEQELAHALRDARHLDSIAERIDALSRQNSVATGSTNGFSLAAMSEMAVRLESGRQSMAGPMDRALGQIDQRQAKSVRARLETEGAQRLFEKALRASAIQTEQRESAAQCFRPAGNKP
jgi:hypothetical protein